MSNSTLEDHLQVALKGMGSSITTERAAVVPALLHVRDSIPDKSDPLRIKAEALRLLIDAHNSPQYCASALGEFLPMAEQALGEDSVILIELVRAHAASCYESSVRQGGGRPKAIRSAKRSLKLIEKKFGATHSAYAETEKLLHKVSQPVHKHSRAGYSWILF